MFMIGTMFIYIFKMSLNEIKSEVQKLTQW